MSKVLFGQKQTAFFTTLEQRVKTYFQEQEVRRTGNLRLYTKAAVFIGGAAGLYVWLVFFTPSLWLAVPLCILLGSMLAFIGFNVMHDGAHGSFSSRSWVNEAMARTLEMMGGSTFMWKMKHNVIHHSYTNVEGVDDDISNEPWFRMSTDQKRLWIHRFQHIYWVVLYAVSYMLWVFYTDYDKYFTGKIGDVPLKKMSAGENVLFWLTKVVYLVLYFGLPMYFVGVIPTIVGYIIMASSTGLVISTIFQMAHVVEHTHFPTVDDETGKLPNEWAVHQVLTTANFSTRNSVLSWFVGGLNFQIEHHLFPMVSHVHYPRLSRIVQQTCEEFDLPYNTYPTLYHAIRSHVRLLRELGAAA